MTALQKFEASLVIMQLLAFVFGIMFGISLEKRRQNGTERPQ